MILDILPPMPVEQEIIEEDNNETISSPVELKTIENKIDQCWSISCENLFIIKTTATSFLIWIISIVLITAIIYLITRKNWKAWTFKEAMKKVWKYYLIMWIIFIILTFIAIKTVFRLTI